MLILIFFELILSLTPVIRKKQKYSDKRTLKRKVINIVKFFVLVFFYFASVLIFIFKKCTELFFKKYNIWFKINE